MGGAGADEVEPERSGGTPADQVAELLARASYPQRTGELDDVRAALMHHCGLQSCRHAKVPGRRLNRRTFRHSFLLADGSVRVLWELEHDTAADARTRRAVFTEQEALALAEWQVDLAFGEPCGPRELPFDPVVGAFPQPAAEGLDALLAAWPAAPSDVGLHRTYTEGDSVEHARRLLRRAANAGAPGDEVRMRLRAAIAHDISIVTRRTAKVAGRQVSWALYEHAFLLLDGTELSLWEIDHTRTPKGEPVCEVYASRDAALDTAVRRIEAG